MNDSGGFIRQVLRKAFDAGNPVVRSAVLGAQVEDFLGSDIGKYLLDRADKEIVDSMRSLKVVSPWRRRRIQQLQNRIQVAENFCLWMRQAYEEGLVALQAIDNEETDGEPYPAA